MFNPVEAIQRKRDGHKLTADEIDRFIAGYVSGDIPDYQMSAMAMAVYFRDMDADETAALTKEMLESGVRMNWDGVPGVKVDKHSTGGMGDKVSLPMAPILACCGLKVPMISGRGLGLTGGTLDKLEAIPGFRTQISIEEVRRLVDRVGVAMAGQTADLVPADRKLYALRDVTATVPSVPLITASILSKKAAETLDALVLDVKWGRGAFMQTLDDASRLAHSLVDVATQLGIRTTALLTDMNQPLGRMVGHANEVNESIAALQGRGPADLKQVLYALTTELLLQTNTVGDAAEAAWLIDRQIESGAALEKFHEMIRSQGGRLEGELETAPAAEIAAEQEGFLSCLHLDKIGYGLIALGAGRTKTTDAVDPSVGVEMLVRLGDRVERGQPLMRVFAKDRGRERALQLFARAFEFSPAFIEPPPLIVERIAPGPPPPHGLKTELETRLVAAALDARRRAYAKYSDFKVGAALADDRGEIFVGVNVENASYGLTHCAERSAVTAAVSAGRRRFKAIAVASKTGVTPCGACRQVLAEFADDMTVLLVDVDHPETVHRTSLHKLLPGRFEFTR